MLDVSSIAVPFGKAGNNAQSDMSGNLKKNGKVKTQRINFFCVSPPSFFHPSSFFCLGLQA